MTPLDYYHHQCQQGTVFEDPQQLDALEHLQSVFNALVAEHQKRSSWLGRLRRPHLIKGVYLWGGVGIGKTFLMDCFFHCLPFEKKSRMHFHQFMQCVHSELTQHQGQSDPLKKIAVELANETEVLCFDEFFVSDITDAMLLGRLLAALFENGVCLVATSNVAPDDLYKNGLQRDQFLPAIAMIKQDTDVIHIPTVIDYRLRHLKEAGVFYHPLDEAAKKNMETSFDTLTQGEQVDAEPINIYGRSVPVKKKSAHVIWFDFAVLCSVPRSQTDYLWLSQHYKTVLISDIPVIDASAKDKICLFISLVDVMYDARVKLVISAAEPVAQLYSRGYMILEYTRTHSRLLEMQSEDYFATEFNRDNY